MTNVYINTLRDTWITLSSWSVHWFLIPSNQYFFCQNNLSFMRIFKKNFCSIKKIIDIFKFMLYRYNISIFYIVLHDLRIVINASSQTFQEGERNRVNWIIVSRNHSLETFRKMDEKCRNVPDEPSEPRFLIDFVMLPFIFGSFSKSFISFYFSR